MAEHDDRDPRPGRPRFQRIVPAAVTPGGTRDARRQPRARALPAVAVAVGLLALLVVAVGLFAWLDQRDAPTATTAVEPEPFVDTLEPGPAREQAASQTTRAEPVVDADELLARRERAQKLAAELADKREALAKRSVERWAAAEDAEIAEFEATGQRRFEQRDYTGAAGAYKQGTDQADELLEKAETVLADGLARGRQALSDGDPRTAVEAFGLARAIDTDNAEAQKGAARAANLDKVLKLMRAGRTHEDAGELARARENFVEARDLDGAYAPAGEAVQRIEAALVQRRFTREMSDGLAALDRGDYTAARDAFVAARKLRPDAAEAADGLAQARAGLQRQAIEQYRRQAHTAAANEDWEAAKHAFEQILAIDKSLGFARTGQQQAAARAELAKGLTYHLEHADRLSAESVRTSVDMLLARARAVPEPGPKLRGRIDRLARRLAAARQPVPVRLRSDNRTQVSVYHVGRLGAFEVRQLELTPGEYTAVGRCQGYRDVRRQFTVAAGQPVGPITIRCEEKL